MEDQDIINSYANLLILQYRQKPNAYATIQALVQMIIMNQLPNSVLNGFDFATAVGAQLDVLGKYIGASRYSYNAIGPVTLSDDDFRSLLKFVVIKNTSDSSLYTIQSLLSKAFPSQVFVSDSTNMSLSYVLIQSLGTPDLLEVLVRGGYLPKPMGVNISATIIPSHTNPFFGFRTYVAPDTTVGPFNSYTFYSTNEPWLSYSGTG
jgi:hypothetical protein